LPGRCFDGLQKVKGSADTQRPPEEGRLRWSSNCFAKMRRKRENESEAQ